MKTLGIIGGMGAEATLDLYGKIVKLTPATKDQEHIHVLIDSFPQIPDRTSFIMGQKEDPTPAMILSAKRLEQAGAEAFCMACNTAHFFAPRVQESVSIPFISIVDCAVNELAGMASRPEKIFVLATIGTKTAKVYETKLLKNRYHVLEIPADLQDNLTCCIYEGVKKGKTEEYVPLFQQTLHQLEAYKPDAMLAACTEIPILTKYIKTNTPIVDATHALAKACVRFGLEGVLPAE